MTHAADTATPACVAPTPTDRIDAPMHDGAIIRLRRYQANGKRRLLLSHGNGLAINAYAPFWAPLIGVYDLVLFDARNHGENPRHLASHHSWDHMIADMTDIHDAIERAWGPSSTVGVFHSLTSVVAMMHLHRHGPRVDGLVLFDSPIMPPADHLLHAAQYASMRTLTRRAAYRQMLFERPEDFAAQLAGHESFSGWVEGAHLLMAQSTLRPKRNGRYELCCPRELEAHIFQSNVDETVWEMFGRTTLPALLIGADPDHPHASPPAAICRAIHDTWAFPYVMIPDTTHFLQLEKPQACRDALTSFLASLDRKPRAGIAHGRASAR